MDGLPAYEGLVALLPTDRELRLRAWRPGDARAVLAALDDRARHWMGPLHDVGPAEASAYVESAPGAWERRRHLRLCVTDDGDAVLGALDLDRLGEGDGVLSGEVELGWWAVPARRGRGQGVRAARLGARVGLEVLGCFRVWAAIQAGNTASRWVAAGAGLHLDAVLRGADAAGGDVELWRLLASEPPLEPQPELTAGRLHLRPVQPSDAEAIAAACADPEVVRWTSVPSPYSVSDAHAFIDGSLGGWARGTGAQWVVLDSVDARLLAVVGVELGSYAVATIGFWAVAAERGHGVVPDAVRAVARWAFGTGWCEVLEWRALVGNTASQRVAEKVGFTVEATLRSRFTARGEPRRDEWVGSLLPGELR